MTALSFAACSDSDPPQMLGYAPPPYGHSRYRPQADWEEDDAPSPDPDRSPAEDSQPEPTPPVTDDSNASPNPPDSTETQPDTSSAPAPTPANLPTAQSIGNGRVESPYAPGKQVDVEGFPPGSTVRDPYTGQLFLVPVPKTGP